MNAKITDLTKKNGNGKWIEVGYFSTNDPNEKLEIVMKTTDYESAKVYADWYNNHRGGITEIIIR